jgi:hypothetical protein
MATYSGDRREQLCEWLRLNGADSDEVPLYGEMTISTDDDGARWLNWEECALIDGGRYMNAWGTAAAVDKHTARLVAEPPDWWEPQIQPTREALIQSRDNAYADRDYALAWLATHHPAVISPANDVDERGLGAVIEEPGWHALVITINGKSMRWHIDPRGVDLFQHVEHVPADDPRAMPGERGCYSEPDRVEQRLMHDDVPLPKAGQPREQLLEAVAAVDKLHMCRESAYDAVFTYIRSLDSGDVQRNGVIWGAVKAALAAAHVPDCETAGHPSSDHHNDTGPNVAYRDFSRRVDGSTIPDFDITEA